jgi:hypothetical protein
MTRVILPPLKCPISELPTTYKSVTLERARLAVRAYNEGVYGCLKNPYVDQQALDMFPDGLGETRAKISRQLEFIGENYGGVAGFPTAIKLADSIANDIYKNFAEYEHAIYSTNPILLEVPKRSTIEILYRPFVKRLHGKSHWQVWAAKFWHFLNHDAFPIEDSRVDTFFVMNEANSVDKYLKFAARFRDFVLSHQEWLPQLREIDGGDASCDNKLWDKMFYGLVDLDSPPSPGWRDPFSRC